MADMLKFHGNDHRCSLILIDQSYTRDLDEIIKGKKSHSIHIRFPQYTKKEITNILANKKPPYQGKTKKQL